MKLDKLKASIAVAAATLIGYSTTWAQTETIRDGCFPNCDTGGGGGDPQLAAPVVLALIAAGIVGAIMMAKRK